MATTQPDGTDRRTTAEITDDGVEPADLRVVGSVRDDLEAAVRAALDAEPNAMDAPDLIAASQQHRDRNNLVAIFTGRFNELPATGDDGELEGWYGRDRALERINEALMPALPDDLGLEFENNTTFGIYKR